MLVHLDVVSIFCISVNVGGYLGREGVYSGGHIGHLARASVSLESNSEDRWGSTWHSVLESI
jgi:hypothetical protein